MTDVPVGASDLLFEARTPLGFSVRVTTGRWKLMITKGSALEIPRTTDDACDELLRFQGQSPWL